MGKNAKLKEKQKWSHEKPHLDNARKLREIYFIDAADKESKETIKNARKKLETPMAPAMPCKISKNNKKCGNGEFNKVKSKIACILEASEATRLRMGESLPTHNEDQYCRKERQFTTALQFGAQIYSYASSHEKFPQQRQQWTRNGKNWKNSAWSLTKVRSKKEVIDEARTSGATVHLASLMDICHLKKAELEAKHQGYKGRVVLRGDVVKDISGSYAVFTGQG